MEHFHEIILQWNSWPMSRCFFKDSILSYGGHFAKQSRTILAIWIRVT